MRRWFATMVWLTIIVRFAVPAIALAEDEVAAELRTFLIRHYGALEGSPISSGVLYDLVLPLSQIERFDGSDTSAAATPRAWLQAAHEMKRASLRESPLPSHRELRERGRSLAKEHVHPVAILNYRYHRIRTGLPADSAIRRRDGQIEAVDAQAFEMHRVFAVSALNARSHRGEKVRFRFDRQALYFTNDPNTLRSLEVDFDDGAGFRAVDGEVSARYSSVGRKTVRVRATMSNGAVLAGKFTFDVIALTTPDPTQVWTIQAQIPFNGGYGSGEAFLYLAEGHAQLERPVIVSEGFDLYNDMNADELYALLNQQNLLETLRAMGYDAVVLNYDNAVTYIQRNAFVVKALLDSVNRVTDSTRTSVLVGASMGGLTTRYALAYMEANAQPHRVRTFISFDAPQRGANIPLGIQYWMDFFSSQSAEAAFLRDALNSPAARQLLIAHFTSPPTNAAADPLRAVMLSDFALIGNYPQTPRLVSVANGSGSALGVGFSPGAQLIRYEYNSWLVSIVGNVWALHNSQSQRIFNGVIDRIWPLPDDRMSVTVLPTWPWDNAPGGLRYSMLQMDTTDVSLGDVIALHPSHCFIPTISALDLDVQDPFHQIADDPDLYDRTPFDTLYFPVENQEHVAVTEQNLWWFIEEICDSLGKPAVVIENAEGGVRLHWRPVAGARSYRVAVSGDWPMSLPAFVTVADTTWTDPDTTRSIRYYAVRAATATASP